MAVTVVLTVATGNLSIGVLAGVVLAALLFARRVQRLTSVRRVAPLPSAPDVARYDVSGELFFASSSDLADHFDYANDPQHVVLDLTDSHLWDATSVAALDSVVTKYAHHGKRVELVGMNEASETLHTTLAGRLGPGR